MPMSECYLFVHVASAGPLELNRNAEALAIRTELGATGGALAGE